ncbi:MAG: hypothetical protein IRY97_00585 [Thermomicrobiaceae bacterium]|nr:hypothetical protein [Thermomicrobiaceae bacterium]
MKRWLLIVTGVLACPCHLPLYLALLGGTALGGALAASRGWLVAAMAVYFAVALIGAVLLTGRRGRQACELAPGEDGRQADGGGRTPPISRGHHASREVEP